LTLRERAEDLVRDPVERLEIAVVEPPGAGT
jgi:hypothetical protein